MQWIIDIIRADVSKKIRYALQGVGSKSKREAALIRTRIIREWFGGYDGSHIGDIRVQQSQLRVHSKGTQGFFELRTWTESSAIGLYSSAERWRSKYGGVPSNEYVPDLSFNEGIIGLPEVSTRLPHYSGRGWKDGRNMNFIKMPNTLTEHILNHHAWDMFEQMLREEIIRRID